MGNPNDWNKTVIEEFRANGGKVGGYFANVTVLLLHTIGAKSQQQRINPLVCMTDGDRLIIAASKRGAPTNPDWYYNLIAQPLVTIEVGIKKFQARATVAAEPERTRLFDQMAAAMPNYAEYQRSTTRIIPVVILTRVP
jgi:deazaflavin-dependent oxidoreductase (nitroreductase family)